MPKDKKPIDWEQYPLRTCLTMHECRLCDGTIWLAEEYYDGGRGRRAHKKCADLMRGFQKKLQDAKRGPH